MQIKLQRMQNMCYTTRIKRHVCGCSIKKLENSIEAIEDKHMYELQEYGESAKEQVNTQIYYYVDLNHFQHRRKLQNHILNGDTSNYSQKTHNEIKNRYNSLWNGSDGIEKLYQIAECSKNRIRQTFKKRSDTKRRFCDHTDSQIELMTNFLKKVCDHIESRQEHNSMEQKMYSNKTS